MSTSAVVAQLRVWAKQLERKNCPIESIVAGMDDVANDLESEAAAPVLHQKAFTRAEMCANLDKESDEDEDEPDVPVSQIS